MRSWSRVLPAVVLVVVFVSCVPAAPLRAEVAKPSLDESGSLIVTAETTEVREGPSRGYAVITIVEKGEIFVKEGRTGAWYYIRINDDAFGWINGRDVGRYQAEGAPLPYVGPEEEPAPYIGPYDARYYPYYPGGYYNYSCYSWGQPYLSWEWYFYGSNSHRSSTWDRDRDYRRDRDRDRYRDDGWHAGEHRTRDDGQHGNGDVHRGTDSHRESSTVHRSGPASRPFGPRIRPPFMRR
ncbi:MAG: SH3 domain-containing protein [Candidatus Methylomirabilia bacterium]